MTKKSEPAYATVVTILLELAASSTVPVFMSHRLHARSLGPNTNPKKYTHGSYSMTLQSAAHGIVMVPPNWVAKVCWCFAKWLDVAGLKMTIAY